MRRPTTPPARRRRGATTRRARLLAALGAVALAVGGCASLPEAGAPQPFDVSVPDTAPIDLAAGGPSKGTSPAELISDFLLACAAGATDDFATARLYLTSHTASTWKPDTEVQVYATDSTPGIDAGDVTRVTLTAQAVATVDDAGVLTRTEDASLITRRFQLARVSGEWRIDGLDDGIVLSEATFKASHRRVDLLFPATTGDALVADPRWYPAKRLATHLLTGLVGGPSDSIAQAVRSAVPEGTTIPSQGMEIVDQVAHVTLTATPPADEGTRTLLAWQLTETLVQADTVSAVDLTVSGTTLHTDGLPTGPTYRVDSAVGVTDDGIGLLTGATVHGLLAARDLDAEPAQPALDPVRGSVLAWTTTEGVSVRDLSGSSTAHAGLADPTWPSVDRFGWTWSTSRGTPAPAPLVLDARGTRASVKAAFTDSSTVERIQVCPDGSRVAMVRAVGTTRGVWVAPVVRDGHGRPTGLGAPVEVPGLSSGVTDVSWAGSTTLVALRTPAGSGSPEVAVVPLGGFVDTLTAPEGARTVTAGATPSDILVTDGAGATLARSGSVWQAVTEKIRSLNYPG